MLSDIVIIQGPLVGTSGMMRLADRLRARGLHVQLPDVLHGQENPPPWSAWSTHLMNLVSLDGRRPVLVGYSASTTLAAELATRIPTQVLSSWTETSRLLQGGLRRGPNGCEDAWKLSLTAMDDYHSGPIGSPLMRIRQP